MTGVVTRRRAQNDSTDIPPTPFKIPRLHKSSSNGSKSNRLVCSLVTFEYGPPELNLYKYVAEESSFLWRKARNALALTNYSKPVDGLVLMHGNYENGQALSMELFDFDSETTLLNKVDTHVLQEREYVVVCYLGASFWEDNEISMQEVRDVVKDIKKTNLFFVIESEDGIEKKKILVKNQCLCSPANVIRANESKGAIYDGLYAILEKNLSRFLSEIEPKVMTRKVSFYKSQLDVLIGKLHSRKHKAPRILTDACIRKIKCGRPFGIMGYRLFGDTLCILENEETVANNEKKMESIRKSIKDNFFENVVFHKIKQSSFHPHCKVRCGGCFLINGDRNKMGTIGIFGEMRSTHQGHSSNVSEVIFLSSAHVVYQGEIAKISVEDNFERIGRCIWPTANQDHDSNLQDISVVVLDISALPKLQRSILKEKVIVDELSKAHLTDRKVFKYGATTGRTEGYVQKIDDFEMFGGEVMAIVPRSTDDEDVKFSDKGDSGAIVLTKFRNQLHAIGMVYGGQFDPFHAECQSAKNESIAIWLKQAVDRFTSSARMIEFDEI